VETLWGDSARGVAIQNTMPDKITGIEKSIAKDVNRFMITSFEKIFVFFFCADIRVSDV
jgi:hypothetical protein